MRLLLSAGLKISRFLYAVSGIALVFMMFLTVLDVILRAFGRPITGAYELVAFSGAVVVGFVLPLTTWTRGQVYMEFLVERLPEHVRNFANVSTRIIWIILFALAAYNLIDVASTFIIPARSPPRSSYPSTRLRGVWVSAASLCASFSFATF